MDIPEQFHFEYLRRVEFSDTDMAGIIHFANYFRYVESAEHAFWRSLGRSIHSGKGEDQHGWPRLNVSCSFFKPTRFEQLLKIRLHIQEVRNTTICYGFYVFDDQEPEPALVAAGEMTIIHVALKPNSGNLEKAPIPDDLRDQLNKVIAPASN
ncbi:MAG: thioesterase family protein [Verrucomicrobia bacterium]|nr:thioesterase family protein [Verrucomicrobiota bacterium]